ncbi:MAG: hypothetical protein DMF56_17645 [Acidobacteria bacterium]|nr:MAG: hypothetical protein DMF56_17645 [Acidobacteriota bacterium]
MSRERFLQLLKYAVITYLGWAGMALFLTTQQRTIGSARGWAAALYTPDVEHFTSMMVWALVTPVVVYVAMRLPIQRPHRLWNAMLLVLFGSVFALGRAVVDATMPAIFEGGPLSPIKFRQMVFALFHSHFFFYTVIVLGTNYARLRREADERRDAEARVEAELADAQLRRLRADLQPHFLFNTLNALATLVHLDPVAARESVGKLIDLLGDSFEARDEKSVALREELAFASRYLDLQKLRFGEKLRTHIDVADEDLLNAAVPRFLLQPLIENSIIHGVRKKTEGGAVTVKAFATDGLLHIEVRDEGPGCDPAVPFTTGGIGVRNTMARLEHLYPNQEQLRFRRDNREFVADVRIPLRFVA